MAVWYTKLLSLLNLNICQDIKINLFKCCMVKLPEIRISEIRIFRRHNTVVYPFIYTSIDFQLEFNEL